MFEVVDVVVVVELILVVVGGAAVPERGLSPNLPMQMSHSRVGDSRVDNSPKFIALHFPVDWS